MRFNSDLAFIASLHCRLRGSLASGSNSKPKTCNSHTKHMQYLHQITFALSPPGPAAFPKRDARRFFAVIATGYHIRAAQSVSVAESVVVTYAGLSEPSGSGLQCKGPFDA